MGDEDIDRGDQASSSGEHFSFKESGKMNNTGYFCPAQPLKIPFQANNETKFF